MKWEMLLIGLLILMPLQGMHTIAMNTPPFWEGDVVLIKNTTFTVVAESGKSYTISYTTALGALDMASKAGNFSYTVSDEWYEQFGSLLITSIAGKKNEGTNGWQYWVNYPDEPLPWVGADKYEVKDGDTVDFFYGGFGITPDTTEMLIRIHVHVVEDNEVPYIDIVKPKEGGVYIFDREILKLPSKMAFIIGELTVEAVAEDELSGIKYVEFYLDGNLQARINEEPYIWKLQGGAGKHILEAKAFDNAGNTAKTERIIWILPL